MFAAEVMPHLQSVWNDGEWENHWWPTGLPERATA
jgi:hypothetical protein